MFRPSLQSFLQSCTSWFWSSSMDVVITRGGINAAANAADVVQKPIAKHDNDFSVPFDIEHEDQFIAALTAKLSTLFSEKTWRSRSVHFVIAGDLVRYFMVRALHNTCTFQDLTDAANLRFIQLYGHGDLLDWQIEANWTSARPFLACAIPKTLTAALLICAKQACVKVDGVVPEFIAAWNRNYKDLSEKKWLLVGQNDRALMGMLDENGLVAVRMITEPSDHVSQAWWLQALLQREAFHFETELPEAILLDGKLASAWSENCTIPIQSATLMRLNMTRGGIA